jgi:hypothetical protein
MWPVEHTAIDADRTRCRIGGESGDDLSRPGKLLRAGRESAVDDRHLRRVDRHFGNEAGAPSRFYARRSVLHDDALRSGQVQPRGSSQEYLRVRFAGCHVLGGNQRLEASAKPNDFQHDIHILPRSRRGDRLAPSLGAKPANPFGRTWERL